VGVSETFVDGDIAGVNCASVVGQLERTALRSRAAHSVGLAQKDEAKKAADRYLRAFRK